MNKNNLIYKVRIYLLYLLIPFIILSGTFYFYINDYLIEEEIKHIEVELKYLNINYLDEYFEKIERVYDELYEITKNNVITEENLDLLDKEFMKYKTDEIKNLYVTYENENIIIFPGKLKMKISDFNNVKWYRETRLGDSITYTNFQSQDFNDNKLILSKTIIDNEGRLKGIMALGLSLNELEKIFINYPFFKKELYMYIDEKKDILSGNRNIFSKNTFKEIEINNSKKVFYINGDLIYTIPLEKIKTILIGKVPYDFLAIPKTNLIVKMSFAFFISFLVFMFISHIILKKLEYEDTLIRDLVSKVTGKENKKTETNNLETLYSEVEKVLESYKSVKREAFVDPLTQIYNRNFLNKHLDSIIKKHQRACVFLFDLDKFKAVNDNLGHDIGDGVLKRIGSTLKSVLSPNNIPIRYGGDEFLVVFLDMELIECYKIVENFRLKVETLDWRENGIEVTVSGGLVVYKKSIEKSMVEADKLLYEAKNNGRNQIVIEL